METQDAGPGYYLWGIDNNAYGPVELPTLVKWIKDERVIADSWIFSETETCWSKAAEVRELAMFFRPKTGAVEANQSARGNSDVTPGSLRRIKALAEMSDVQLTALIRFLEVVLVPPFTHLIHKGEPSDAMFGVLQGELRSCIIVDGKERPLATLAPGSVFGEISLFDKGPHAADVITNEETLLVRISAEALAKFSKEEPDAARELLFGLVKAIAGRVRTLTKRYEDSIHTAHQVEAARVH